MQNEDCRMQSSFFIHKDAGGAAAPLPFPDAAGRVPSLFQRDRE